MGSSVLLPPPGQPKTGPDAAFKSSAVPNIVTFQLDRAAPPSNVYIQRDDVLILEVASTFQPITVTLFGRMLLAPYQRGGQPDGPPVVDINEQPQSSNLIEPILGQLVYTGGVGVTQQLKIPLSEGYLLSVSAFDSANSQRGATFVRAFLARGASTPLAPQSVFPLFADYTTQNAPIGWPNGRIVYPTEGPGDLFYQTVGQPAAGTDWLFTLPLNVRFRLRSLAATLTTSAAVANRIPRIQLKNISALIYYQGAVNQVIAASTAAKVSAQMGQVGTATDVTTVNIGLSGDVVLESGDSVVMNTLNLQGADQWSSIVLQFEQWLDNGNT